MIRISVVIPSYNAASTLSRTLESLDTQTLERDDYEVFIVDDGSTDGSEELVGAYPHFHLISQQNSGPGAARNNGTRRASGEIIAFTDADCVLPPDWLERNLLLHEQHPEIDAMCGSVRPATPLPYGSSILADHLCSWFNAHDRLPERTPEHIPSAMLSVKRRVFDAGIEWSEQRTTGEDLEISRQMAQRGMKLRCFPSLAIRHIDRPGFRGFLRHQYNWGFHAPFIRGRRADTAYSFLFPASMVGAWFCAPSIVAGYTLLTIKSWWRVRPVGLLSALPLIVLGKLSYARGVLHGTRALIAGTKGFIADRKAPSAALPLGV